MIFAAIGDNCFDVYEQIKVIYPTGNVVDTAVHMQRLGIQTSIISTTGNDEYGREMIAALKKEGVDLSHFHIGNGATAVTQMEMNGLDRVHVKYDEGVLATMEFSAEDILFAASHDFVHSSLWGKTESVMPLIKEQGAVTSFDYSDRLEHPIIDKTISYIDYGFFSYHGDVDDYIKNFMQDTFRKGLKVCVVTLGKNGSICYDGNEFYHYPALPTLIVNTVGAGDSFIAGFLFAVMNNLPLQECLGKGAKLAADVISEFEPW